MPVGTRISQGTKLARETSLKDAVPLDGLITVSRESLITETGKKSSRNINLEKRPFIAWDGEAVVQYRADTRGEIVKEDLYCLLGCSTGDEVSGRYLSTVEMLELILSVGANHPHSFHIAFAFDYDVNNILKDVPWFCLIQLKARGRCIWNGYHIEHVPHKAFVVRKDGVRVRIEDVFSYFRMRYDLALVKYNVGDDEIRKRIADGKAARGRFLWRDIDEIREYFRAELQTMPELMEHIRKACYAADMRIGSWYGPGALAKHQLARHDMQRHMLPTPEPMSVPVRTAFAGGWFERFRAGVYYAPVYTADLNSAYAWAMTLLPSLRGGWDHVRRGRALTDCRAFGVYRIRLNHGNENAKRRWNDYMRACHGVPLPLFMRHANGNISRPVRADGWYWTYEARQVARLPHAEIVEAWIVNDDGERPFEWVENDYNARAALQAVGDPAEKAIKWALASIFGTTAQRVGWDRKTGSPPRWHQLEWAGAITSACRSLILSAAMPVALKSGLVSIDTDGIISTVPFQFEPGEVGDGLGQWKLEEYTAIIYIQNGIYWLRNMDGEWLPPKTRGISYGQIGDPEIALRALRSDGKLHLVRHSFVGYGAALHSKDRSRWRTWEDQPYDIDIARTGSRQHIRKFCRSCNRGLSFSEALHDLALTANFDTRVSEPHSLPWLSAPDDAQLEERVRYEMEQWIVNMEFG